MLFNVSTDNLEDQEDDEADSAPALSPCSGNNSGDGLDWEIGQTTAEVGRMGYGGDPDWEIGAPSFATGDLLSSSTSGSLSSAPLDAMAEKFVLSSPSSVSPSNSSLDPLAEVFVPGPRFGDSAPVLSVTDKFLSGADPETPDQDCTLTSTPSRPSRGRPTFRQSPISARGPRLMVKDWSFMPGRRNARRRRNLNRKINYTDEGEVTLVPEKNKNKTGLRWQHVDPLTLKFVDDSMILSKVNMDSAEIGPPGGARVVKVKHDIASQNVFRRIVSRAESREMVVNKGKTKILCISDVMSYRATTYLQDADGNRLESGKTRLKILGFYMDSRPSAHAQTQNERHHVDPTAPQNRGVYPG